MHKDLAMKKIDFTSSFLSCEKDAEIILKRLFVESRPYSDYLKKLLVINTKDCLDENSPNKDLYAKKIKEMSLPALIDKGYLKVSPKIKMPEHEEIKSYIIIGFDNFSSTSNPEFRDCTINFDILCHNDYWDLGNFRQRPLKIAGYIDGMLNKCKLTGIGRLEFLGCNMLVLDEALAGYTLSYRAVHGSDDKIQETPLLDG